MGHSAEQMQVTLAATSFCFCSVGMLLFNKLAVQAFPLECLLVAAQMAFASLALLIFGWKTLHVGSLRDLLRWCLVIPFFSSMLLTSILALKNAPMSVVVVFRCLSPIGAIAIERFYPDPFRVSGGVLASVFIMILGASLYTSQMPHTHLEGIGWVCLNSFLAIFERSLQRLFLSKDQYPVDISKTAVTLLNNFLGMIPVIIAAYCTGEFHDLPAALAKLDTMAIIWVGVSCVIGLGISYCAVWAQSLITATSFLVMVNANKFVIIFIEAFGIGSKRLSPIEILGATITVAGGCLYGLARQDVERQMSEKTALTQANSQIKQV